MKTIHLTDKPESTKEGLWIEIGKKFKADTLEILKGGEAFPSRGVIVAKFGYILTWKTIEDDIHVFGDGKGNVTGTMILLDSSLYDNRSMAKLQLALNCVKHIEANRKKYYHILR